MGTLEWKHSKKPIDENSLNIRIHHKTNEHIYYLYVLEE